MRQEPLHVMHVISGLGHGGAETVLYRLVTASQPRVRHTVVSMGGEGVLGGPLRTAGIDVICLDMVGARGVALGLARLFRLLRTRRPDVVQTWMYHADLVGGLLARLAGIRAIAWGIRNSGVSLSESSRGARASAWLCARLSGIVPAVIVACAQKAAQVHRGWGYRADRLLVIPNGYDLSIWHPDAARRAAVRAEWNVPPAGVLVGCVARWNPLKDHANMFAALALCVRTEPALRCALIGLGMSRDNAELVALARHYGLLDHLLFLGRRDDVPALMPALDIHVLSSKAEGFPNVVAEAMAAGVACVVTDVGDAAQIVGEHGWVAPPGDAVGLARALDRAITAVARPDWPARREVARESVASRYSLPAMVARYGTVWQRLAEDFPRRSRGVGPTGRVPAGGAAGDTRTAATPRKAEPDGAGTTSAPCKATPDGAAATRSSAPILLYFINNPAFFLSHRLPLALAARQAGFDVHVATMAGPAVARIRAQGFEHHEIGLSRSGMRPWTELRSLLAFLALLRRLRPTLVHSVTIKPVLYGGIACRLAHVPAYVAAISGLGYMFMHRRGWRRSLRGLALLLYRLALGHPNSRVIFQNSADRDVLLSARAVRPAQVVMVRGSGVDLRRFAPQPFPQGAVTIVMAARLLRDKGVGEFAEAARLCAQRGLGLRWRLAGSPDPGNPASIHLATVQAWHAAGLVDYVGECDDVAAFYAAAHIVVLPSYREGLPKSLIEAAACGRPVVTTDVPGCRDALEAGVTGLLVPPRDALALADAVAQLAADASLRERFGAAGRALAEREFGLEQVVQAHLRIYRALVGGPETVPMGGGSSGAGSTGAGSSSAGS